MSKRNFQVTKHDAFDGNLQPVAVGEVIEVDGELPSTLVNKGIFITGATPKSEKELVVATPSEDDDKREETAMEKQARINRKGRQRAKVQ